MSASDALARYLDLTARRLRLYAALRGTAILAVAALILTILLAWILTSVAASPASIFWSRVVLFGCMAGIAARAIVLPVMRTNAVAAAHMLERGFPAFSERLLTFIDRRKSGTPDPFLPLLAETALEIVKQANPQQLLPRRRLAAFTSAGLAAILTLFGLILRGPRDVAALWTGKDNFLIEVKAPRKTIRRGASLTVTAKVSGFTAQSASLWIRGIGAGEWKSRPMLAFADKTTFGLELPEVGRDIEYYAESAGVRSSASRLRVVDLPAVTGIKVTYPDHSVLARSVNGDIIAPAGTIASLEIQTDRPMDGAQLTLELADPVGLPSTIENRTSASLIVLRDDGYHVSVKYDGEDVPVSGEHAIEVLVGAETTRKNAMPLLRGNRVGPVPRGYEKSVSDYYRRLSEQQTARR